MFKQCSRFDYVMLEWLPGHKTTILNLDNLGVTTNPVYQQHTFNSLPIIIVVLNRFIDSFSLQFRYLAIGVATYQ